MKVFQVLLVERHNVKTPKWIKSQTIKVYIILLTSHMTEYLSSEVTIAPAAEIRL
jgi:hypothetical protein